jgi:hypothetical protein
VSWDQNFDDPILLPKGKPLVTLHDAALYITKLPKAEHDADEWQHVRLTVASSFERTADAKESHRTSNADRKKPNLGSKR